MRGIILAAGRGVRMGKLTNGKPKCLIKYKGKRLLEHQIDCFRRSNINDIAIVTGYKREMLSRFKLKEFNNPKCVGDGFIEGGGNRPKKSKRKKTNRRRKSKKSRINKRTRCKRR